MKTPDSNPGDNKVRGGAGRDRPVVMIVDDEPQVAATIAELLRRRYCVLTATSGAEALSLLPAEDVAVVISDQRMPAMEGVELLRRVAATCPHTVRILLTGYADLQTVIQAVNEAKIFFYLTKPFRMQEIEAAVEAGVARYESLRQRERIAGELRRRNEELEKLLAAQADELRRKTAELEQALAVIAGHER